MVNGCSSGYANWRAIDGNDRESEQNGGQSGDRPVDGSATDNGGMSHDPTRRSTFVRLLRCAPGPVLKERLR